MPKDTYLNLSEKKREMILNTAIDEFYEYGFEKASISKIVNKAGIAKGSFYQYFEDKEDLFSFVIENARERKLIYFSEIINSELELDFFELLRELYRASLNFLKGNPKLSSINDSFLISDNNKLKDKIMNQGIDKSNQFLKDLLRKGIENGKVNHEIDLEFTAYIITSISITLGDYCRRKYGDLIELEDKDYYKLVDKTIDLLKHGMATS